MKKMKSSARALLKSALALLLCISMLIGSTFAWFTDEVTSAGNIIKSGNLDIDMQWAAEYKGEETQWNDAAGENAKPVFDYQNWEPGYTEVRYIKVSNEGNLAFKWLMSIIPVGMVGKLAEVIDVRYDIVSENPHFTAPTAENKIGSLVTAGTLTDVIAGDETVVQGVLLPEGEEAEGFYSGEVVACITLHMREDAGNEYQGENVGDSFNILLKATQYAYEYDSFGNDYDLESTYPHIVTDLQLNASIKGLVDENNRLTKEIILTDPPTGISATIPVGTIVDVDATQLVLRITEDDVHHNVTLDNRVGYDVEVIGVAFNNDKPIVVFMPKVLPAKQIGTQLFHAGKAMTRVYTVEALSQREGNNDTYGDKYIYDDNSGNVYFSLIHFSNVSLASTDTVNVLGEEMAITGNTYDLKDYEGGTLTIPADDDVHLIQFTREDKSSKNALDLTLTHTWHNLNPGKTSSTALKVEKGAKVVLSGVNIRTNSGVDALEIINPANVTENKVGDTYIYVADGTQNWLTGKSGIGFGANSPNYVADIYVEGHGSLYTTAMGWGSPGIGVDSYSDGNQSKMHFKVGFLRSIPMNAAAGIGGGFAGQSWFSLGLVEINGGTYHLYRGGDSASIGTGTNGDIGEIIINKGSTVNCYTNPWTAYGRDMGRGMYAGNCAGIYVSEDADVLGWSHVNRAYGKWIPGHGYVPSGRTNDANVVVNGFSEITDLQAKINENGEVVSATATVNNETVEIDPDKCKYSDGKVIVAAVYGKDVITGNTGIQYLKTYTENTITVDEDPEVSSKKIVSLELTETSGKVNYQKSSVTTNPYTFTVKAIYEDGTTEDVTDKATLKYVSNRYTNGEYVEDESNAYICARGEQTVTATVDGIESNAYKFIIGDVFITNALELFNNIPHSAVKGYYYVLLDTNVPEGLSTSYDYKNNPFALDNSSINGSDFTTNLGRNQTTLIRKDAITLHGWNEGPNEKEIIIDTGNFCANGSESMYIYSNDVTLRNLTLTNFNGDKNDSTKKCPNNCGTAYYGIKVSQYASGSSFTHYSNFVLDGVTIEHNGQRSALLVHGVDNVIIKNCNIRQTTYNSTWAVIGIANTGAAGSKGVTISNTQIAAECKTAAHIQFNYEANKTSEYGNSSTLHIDDTVTFINGDGNVAKTNASDVSKNGYAFDDPSQITNDGHGVIYSERNTATSGILADNLYINGVLAPTEGGSSSATAISGTNWYYYQSSTKNRVYTTSPTSRNTGGKTAGNNSKENSSTTCVTGDTLVMLADGSQKRIDQVTYDDVLLTWDFETGKYATAPASFIHNHGMDNYRVLTLTFSDGTKVKVIEEHGFFDKNVNDFVYITEENVASYVGDSFVKVDGSTYKTVKLVSYKVTEEYVGNYSLQTAIYNNAVVEGMFSMTGPDFEGWFDYFDITDDMKYDEEHKKAEIEKYGLTSYEDWADYVTYEQFVAFNGQYVNILVGRGTVTYENIFEMFETVFGD